MSEPTLPRIRIVSSQGIPLIREGLKICFYMHRARKDIGQEVLNALDTYLDAVGTHALGWFNDHQGDWSGLDASGWEATRREILEGRWPGFELVDDPAGVHAFRFEYYGKQLVRLRDAEPDAVSAVGFWLPTEFLEAQGPARVLELALALGTALPFSSGHAGLSFNALRGVRQTEEELARVCLRYPGIDIADVDSLSWQLGHQLRGPAWLTFLGPLALGRLGDTDTLRSRLHSPHTEVRPLAGGSVAISLGPRPEAGDTLSGHPLTHYRELAHALGPWLHHTQGPWAYFPEEVRQKWERRFLD
ncbi:Protein of unknown function [Stigmatella aurantiaca]|uniref:DUF3396 domain-containing protein n=1 Tax=Stigmatella aurantiaca TaxID=41 RepID=A0A1H7URE6_STIAU|nr:type VI immunity family protein [Stigmatella aurantiaca]SEL99339.1 Protein of unknown function [Stigmatella aurantiaca]